MKDVPPLRECGRRKVTLEAEVEGPSRWKLESPGVKISSGQPQPTFVPPR